MEGKFTTTIALQRRILNMSQEELAEKVGVRRETIARLEKGLYNPSLKLAWDIAKVFNMKIEELFQFEVELED